MIIKSYRYRKAFLTQSSHQKAFPKKKASYTVFAESGDLIIYIFRNDLKITLLQALTVMTFLQQYLTSYYCIMGAKASLIMAQAIVVRDLLCQVVSFCPPPHSDMCTATALKICQTLQVILPMLLTPIQILFGKVNTFFLLCEWLTKPRSSCCTLLNNNFPSKSGLVFKVSLMWTENSYPLIWQGNF